MSRGSKRGQVCAQAQNRKITTPEASETSDKPQKVTTQS